jgi:hypothetical protein
VASIEARLQVALDELRRVNGTVAVLLKQNDLAKEVIEEVQHVLSLIGSSVVGKENLKTIAVLDKACMAWRRRQDSINI